MGPQCMRSVFFAVAAILCAYAQMARADVFPDTVWVDGFEACSGLQCQRVACAGGSSTTISGTVFMPNATLSLPGVEIYVPNVAPANLPAPPVHMRCNQAPSGHPIAATLSADDGSFTLRNVPVGQNIPVVLLAGKWRRQITVANVAACTDTVLGSDLSRLPRTRSEGDIPRIAVATGAADSTECLVRKSGIDDSEFGIAGGTQRVHLFAATGADRFDAAHGSAFFPAATTLWANQSSLATYDQVLFGCEGVQNPSSKPPTALNGLKGFVDAGGRAQIAHWGNYWIQANAASWVSLATWNNSLPIPANLVATVDDGNPAARRLGAWLVANSFAMEPASIDVQGPKHTLLTVAGAARRMLYADNVDGSPSVQFFEATTPVEDATQPLGRLIFTDMHPSGADVSSPGGSGFPSAGCHSPISQIAPQDAALLYAMFDLERCVDDARN